MTVTPEGFRRALARLAGGVAIVTSRGADGEPRGMTATAVCSVSLTPPLVLASLDLGANTTRAVRSSGVYALHFLGQEHLELAERFATDETDKFAGLRTSAGVTGAPLLDGVLAWCDCSVERAVEAGDHTLFIGRVEAVGVLDEEARPLVHYLGRYRSLGGERGHGTDGAAIPRAGRPPADRTPETSER